MPREAYYQNDNLPPSVNDAQNGLLLCPNCHGYFHKPQPEIRISHDGTLTMNKKCKKNPRYKLDGTKVPWADKIRRPNYPSPDLLKFALPPLMNAKNKRAQEVLEDDEDNESDEEYLVQGRRSAKRSAKVQVRLIFLYSSSNIYLKYVQYEGGKHDKESFINFLTKEGIDDTAIIVRLWREGITTVTEAKSKPRAADWQEHSLAWGYVWFSTKTSCLRYKFKK